MKVKGLEGIRYFLDLIIHPLADIDHHGSEHISLQGVDRLQLLIQDLTPLLIERGRQGLQITFEGVPAVKDASAFTWQHWAQILGVAVAAVDRTMCRIDR